MLKSCAYCGRIHDTRYTCPAKAKSLQRYTRDTKAQHIRDLSRWQKTREWIKRRDNGVCQLCIRNYLGTIRPYETEGLSVHHIIKLEEDESRAFDEYNLITLCRTHHEAVENQQGDETRELLLGIAKINTDRSGA